MPHEPNHQSSLIQPDYTPFKSIDGRERGLRIQCVYAKLSF